MSFGNIEFNNNNNYNTDKDNNNNNNDNHNNNNNDDNIRYNNNSTSSKQKELFRILNSQKPELNNNISLTNQLNNSSNITDEDLAFLKAANEVIKLNESKVDPTIRDILNRLQYSNSPHGGLPISMEYMKSIGESPIDSFSSTNDNINTISNNNISNDNDNNNNNNQDLQSKMSLLSTDDLYPNNFIQNSPTNSIIPPFTENPLRHTPTNLDFPQFSLDIFKTANDFVNNQNQLSVQNLSSNLLLQQRQRQNYDHDDVHNEDNDHDKTEGYYSEDEDDEDEDEDDEEGDDEDDEGIEFNDSDMEQDGENQNYRNEIDNIPNNIQQPPITITSKVNKNYQKSGTRDKRNNSITNTNNNTNNTTNNKAKSHNDDEVRNFKCGNCGITFKRSSDLKRHEKIHLKVPPNICPLCHKGFARRDALKRHVNTLTCKRNRERLLKELEARGDTLQEMN